MRCLCGSTDGLQWVFRGRSVTWEVERMRCSCAPHCQNCLSTKTTRRILNKTTMLLFVMFMLYGFYEKIPFPSVVSEHQLQIQQRPGRSVCPSEYRAGVTQEFCFLCFWTNRNHLWGVEPKGGRTSPHFINAGRMLDSWNSHSTSSNFLIKLRSKHTSSGQSCRVCVCVGVIKAYKKTENMFY